MKVGIRYVVCCVLSAAIAACSSPTVVDPLTPPDWDAARMIQTDVGGIGLWRGDDLVAILLSFNGRAVGETHPPAFTLEYLITEYNSVGEPAVQPFLDMVNFQIATLEDEKGRCLDYERPHECIQRMAGYMGSTIKTVAVFRSDARLEVDMDPKRAAGLSGLPTAARGAIMLPASDSHDQPAVLLHYRSDEEKGVMSLRELYFGGMGRTPLFPLQSVAGIEAQPNAQPPENCAGEACYDYADNVVEELEGPEFTPTTFVHANACIRVMTSASDIRNERAWPRYGKVGDTDGPCEIRRTAPSFCWKGRCTFGQFKMTGALAPTLP